MGLVHGDPGHVILMKQRGLGHAQGMGHGVFGRFCVVRALQSLEFMNEETWVGLG